jgi:hypothetical protein
MASDIFAKIGDIKGESTDNKHKDEIEVLSFSWGVTNEVLSFSWGVTNPRHQGWRRRRRRQGELPGSFLPSHDRQGLAQSAARLRDR